MDNTYKAILNKLSLKYGVPIEVIKEIVEAPYGFTREKVKEIDFNEIQESEDLDDIKSTFRLMGFGSFHVSLKKLKAIHKNINDKK